MLPLELLAAVGRPPLNGEERAEVSAYCQLRLAGEQRGHRRGSPLRGSGGSTERSRETRSGSSDASYASIAASVALFFKSSSTILSNVSRLVCQVYWR